MRKTCLDGPSSPLKIGSKEGLSEGNTCLNHGEKAMGFMEVTRRGGEMAVGALMIDVDNTYTTSNTCLTLLKMVAYHGW